MQRAGLLGIGDLPDRDIARNVRRRSRDWSQVRPEWALANNAAFIAAPRGRTIDADLSGRAFLHEYQWRDDDGFTVLELIMTAPMVVANWINMQYYGSVVDNQRFGSGNKVLHNVVGGAIGVLEGNGGDLRVGLPLQSLHDGERWVHEPLRLSVFIEAPESAIRNGRSPTPTCTQRRIGAPDSPNDGGGGRPRVSTGRMYASHSAEASSQRDAFPRTSGGSSFASVQR